MIHTIQYPQDNGIKYREFQYPGGEKQVRFDDVAQADLVEMADDVIVTARITNGEIMGLALLINAIRNIRWSTQPITLVLPYMPYARADRKFTHGDSFGLRVFANMLNELNCKVVTLDAHSEVTPLVIHDCINVSPEPIIRTVIEDIDKPLMLVFPDDGARRYKKLTGLHCEKKRDPATGKLSGFTVPRLSSFDGCQSALIVDDICDGGGTFIGIAKELQSYGLDLYLYVTHGIFSKGFYELFQYFKHVYTTDSLPPLEHEEQFEINKSRITRIPVGGFLLDNILSRPDVWAHGFLVR